MLRDDQVIVYWMSRIDYEKSTGVKSHYHDDLHQMLYIVEGAGYININGTEYKIESNQGYIFLKQDVHSFKFSQLTSTLDIKFNILSEEFEKLFIANLPKDYMFQGLTNKLQELFKLSIVNLNNEDEIIPYRIDVLFKDILLNVIQKEKFSFIKANEEDNSILPKYNEDEKDLDIIEYLYNNIDKEITLEKIAEKFNYHPHYIIQLFKNKYNSTPINFLQKIRIEKSKDYLEYTSYAVGEIASKIGWSIPYFSRKFKENTGVSPTKYRQSKQTVIGKHILLEEEFTPVLDKQPKIIKKD